MKETQEPFDERRVAAIDRTWWETRDAIQKLKSRDQSKLDVVVSFLGRDEYWHGSGYLKEAAWKYLQRASLNETQICQLQKVALRYVTTRLTREFFPMCRFICHTANKDFQNQVEHLTRSDDKAVRRRAILLAAYFESLDQGERNRHKSLMLWLSHL